MKGRLKPTLSPHPVSDLDLSAPEVMADPIPHLAALRASGPVHYLTASQSWFVLGYDEVRAALAQPEIYSSRCLEMIDPFLIGTDPPAHDRARRAMARFFAPEALGALTEQLDAHVAALIAPEFDVVGGFAVPLTRRTTSELLGLAPERVQFVIDASLALRTGAAPPTLPGEIANTVREARLHARLTDSGVADDDAASVVALLCAAASETVERVVIRAALALLEEPALLAAVRDQPSLLPELIEEVMRLYPPEPAVIRITTAPAGLGGVAIPVGAPVLLSLAAANRDPLHFEAPDAIRLGRRGKAHIAFGSGVHQCIGAGLGRRIALAAIKALIERDLRPAEPLESLRFHPIQRMPMPARLRVAT